jgi:hypothetical protein
MNRKLYLPPSGRSCAGSCIARALARLILVWMAVAAAPAMAAALAVVDSVQAPAWLERSGRIQPLAPGFELQSGDIVRTGGGARAYLKLAEGSMVKLGELATLVFYSRSLQPQRFFRGALDIGAGAFRFTTDASKRGVRRDVSIRVATATIGIGGTDVWGKAARDRDLVALINGQVELVRLGELLKLTPMSYLDAPRDGSDQIRALAPELLARFALETEIQADAGASRPQGKWRISFGVADDPQQALQLYDRAREAGYAARIRPLASTEPGGWRYELQVAGFADAGKAKRAAARFTELTGLSATTTNVAR